MAAPTLAVLCLALAFAVTVLPAIDAKVVASGHAAAAAAKTISVAPHPHPVHAAAAPHPAHAAPHAASPHAASKAKKSHCRLVVGKTPGEFASGTKFDLEIGLAGSGGAACGPRKVTVALHGPKSAHFGSHCPPLPAAGKSKHKHKNKYAPCRHITVLVAKGKKARLSGLYVHGRPGGSYSIHIGIGPKPARAKLHKAEQAGMLVVRDFTVSGKPGEGAFGGALMRVFVIIAVTLTGVGVVGVVVYRKCLVPMIKQDRPNGGGGAPGGKRKKMGGIGGYGSV